MKRLFILFVAVHLLIDLAMPSLPGAFRFNPDESVVGVRVEPARVPTLAPAYPTNLLTPVDLPGFELKIPVLLQRGPTAPELISLLPRRNPSSDRFRQTSSEDH